ncbi:hypothetical protein [Duganella radicis]|uniref:Uncharacterized protein n=1 Tax=Duganella radicis TaxID=551988 RepID=A0A6L6PF23_9BURK|nr:hypothetical protein [Duganella radicis]MTV37706.1 hypothetical protein [Duganella radicis]
MTILDRLRNYINQQPDQVLLRSELKGLGGHSQLSVALGTLIDDGVLMRMGQGVFAKARKNARGKTELMCDDAEVVLHQFFRKRRIDADVVKTESSKKAQKYVVETFGSLREREIRLGSKVIVRFQPTRLAKNIPTDIELLPKKRVGEFVKSFAKAHGIVRRPSKIDVWAEAVSRAAGDHVQLDDVGQILVSLFKAKLISGPQRVRLMTNYLVEQREKEKALRKKSAHDNESLATP